MMRKPVWESDPPPNFPPQSHCNWSCPSSYERQGEGEGWPKGSRPHEAPVPGFTHSSSPPPILRTGGGVSPAQVTPTSPPWDSESVRRGDTCAHLGFPPGFPRLYSFHSLSHTHTHPWHQCRTLPSSFPAPSPAPRLTLARTRASSIHLSTRRPPQSRSEPPRSTGRAARPPAAVTVTAAAAAAAEAFAND